MSKQKMTITRGLAELKLIRKKIDKSILGSSFISTKKKSSDKVEMVSVEDYMKDAKASKKSIEDNLDRYKRIKSAITASNAATEVAVGNNKYKVAEAIERKTSISFEQDFLISLKSQFERAYALTEEKNQRVQNNLDNMLEQSFSKENTKDLHQEQEAMSESYLKMNEFELVDPLNIKKLIDKLESEIDEFLFEVDFSLSESNSKTEIEI